MRKGFLTALAFCLISGSALAQTARGWVDVNFGAATAAEDQYDSGFDTTLFGETASFGAAYSWPRGASFDVGGGYLVTPRLGVALTFAGSAHDSGAGLAITVPHPRFFNAFASDATVTENVLQRAEGAVHIAASLVVSETDRLRVRVSGGPSYFRVEQDTIGEIFYDHFFQPFNVGNAVEITEYDTIKSEASGWGFHGGADVAYFFTRIVGIGGIIRVSRGSVTLEDYGGDTDVKTGGVQAGGGLRLRF